MKKILILAMLLVTYSNLFAFLRQANWRWRKDDGTEITATWLANENTAPTISSSTDILRLRIEVLSPLNQNTDTNDTLQWAVSTAGPWTNIETQSTTAPFIIAGSSAYVTQGEPTTSQLSASLAYTWYPGKITVDSMLLKATLPPDNRTEYEWCLKPTPNILTNTTYYFRTWGSISELQNGKTYPSLKTAAVLPICFASFSVSAEGKKAKLEWVTSCEKNNSHFDVEQSRDGINWTKISTLKAVSNSDQAVKYTAYDNSPVNGTNFYRIRQFDFDGRTSVSVVRSLKIFAEAATLLQVYPNPVKDKINFSLQKMTAENAAVTLYNTNGKIVHNEILKKIDPNTTYTLHLQTRPMPGVYILKIKAASVEESIKVVVE